MKPLNSLSKRDLLAQEKFDPEIVQAYADAFFAEERYSDALDFYLKLQNKTAIGRLKEAAVKTGTPDLLWRIEHDNREAVTREDWSQCGENAMRLGKFRAAAYVFERIGDQEKLATAESEIGSPESAVNHQNAPDLPDHHARRNAP